MPKSLDVYINGQLIGYLHDHEPLTFTYTNECISGLVSSPIEKIIPLETGEINSPAVHAYFENLLPEGDQRNSLEKRHQPHARRYPVHCRTGSLEIQRKHHE